MGLDAWFFSRLDF
jgi:hypothetical protein